jgi:hypothetical protein
MRGFSASRSDLLGVDLIETEGARMHNLSRSGDERGLGARAQNDRAKRLKARGTPDAGLASRDRPSGWR